MWGEPIEIAINRDWMDWATLVVTAVAAAATVAAVWVAVAVASRDSRDRRRLQATMVSAWEGTSDSLPNATANTVIVQNASTSAIYDVLFSWASSWGHGKADVAEWAGTVWLAKVPPGSWRLEAAANPGGAMDVRIGVLMEFTDGAGSRWMRTARGELRRISNSPWLADTRKTNKPGHPLTRISRP